MKRELHLKVIGYAMGSFISQKARVDGCIEADAVILGPSIVGSGTIIGRDVIIGYPAEKTIKVNLPSKSFNIERYDTLSSGARIGKNCILRSGTVIYELVNLGDNVRTGHNVLIREGSTVGEETLIGSSAKLDGTVKVGKRTNIQSNVYLPHLTVIGDDVFIAPNVCITNDPYPPSKRLTGVVVEKGAIIGANATIIAGVKIGENAVVGAGAVVTNDVPADTVVIGNPARKFMTRSEFNEKKKKWEKSLKD